MTEKIPFTVREATEADYPGVVSALTDAFEADPVMSQAMGGAHRAKKVKALFEHQISSTYGPKGNIDIAVAEDGFVLGAALWIDPQGQKGGFLDDLRSLPSYARALGFALPAAVVTEMKLLAMRPRFPHWYLYTIGVHTDARDHGVGGALLDFRTARLGEYPAYLEASTFRSAALYRKRGFVELGRYRSEAPAVGMWHPAPVSAIDSAL